MSNTGLYWNKDMVWDWNIHYGTKTGQYGSEANIDGIGLDEIEISQHCIEIVQYWSETPWCGATTYNMEMTLNKT